MSGNPPRPGSDKPDELPRSVEKMKATIAILDLLVPFDDGDRKIIITGVLGAIDSHFADIITQRMARGDHRS